MISGRSGAGRARRAAFAALLTALASAAGAQAAWSVAPIADYLLPILNPTTDGNGLYEQGWAGGLALDLPLAPAAAGVVRATYGNMTTNGAGNASILAGEAGFGWIFRPIDRLLLRVEATGGLANLTTPQIAGTSLAAGLRLGASFRISPTLAFGARAGLSSYFGADFSPFMNAVTLGLAFSIDPAFIAGAEARVEIDKVALQPIFPVFYTYYDDHPFGSVRITNAEGSAIRDVRVSFYSASYMDQPKLCARFDSIPKGGAESVAIKALFNDSVVELTEGTKAEGRIVVDYKLLGSGRQASRAVEYRMHHRNAMNWADDRRAAAFVSPLNPAVLWFSRFVSGVVRDRMRSDLDRNLQFAIGIFETERLFGLSYVIDPSSSYVDNAANESAVDYLQYPHQTLFYRGGDCDDLSILFTSLLESVGIETAFITVPGHIFAAFASGLTEQEARRSFYDPNLLVFRDGKAWIPVEITMVKEGFTKAWRVGAKEWYDNAKSGQAVMLPMAASWKLYPPASVPGVNPRFSLPDESTVAMNFDTSLDRYVVREVEPLVARAKSTAVDPSRAANELGVLYGRFGMLRESWAQFGAAAKAGFQPAWTNLGNIAFLRKDYKRAVLYYQWALKLDKRDSLALLGLARSQYELERYDESDKTYALLAAADPALAKKYGYLASIFGGEGRAWSLSERFASTAWSLEPPKETAIEAAAVEALLAAKPDAEGARPDEPPAVAEAAPSEFQVKTAPQVASALLSAGAPQTPGAPQASAAAPGPAPASVAAPTASAAAAVPGPAPAAAVPSPAAAPAATRAPTAVQATPQTPAPATAPVQAPTVASAPTSTTAATSSAAPIPSVPAPTATIAAEPAASAASAASEPVAAAPPLAALPAETAAASPTPSPARVDASSAEATQAVPVPPAPPADQAATTAPDAGPQSIAIVPAAGSSEVVMATPPAVVQQQAPLSSPPPPAAAPVLPPAVAPAPSPAVVPAAPVIESLPASILAALAEEEPESAGPKPVVAPPPPAPAAAARAQVPAPAPKPAVEPKAPVAAAAMPPAGGVAAPSPSAIAPQQPAPASSPLPPAATPAQPPAVAPAAPVIESLPASILAVLAEEEPEPAAAIPPTGRSTTSVPSTDRPVVAAPVAKKPVPPSPPAAAAPVPSPSPKPAVEPSAPLVAAPVPPAPAVVAVSPPAPVVEAPTEAPSPKPAAEPPAAVPAEAAPVPAEAVQVPAETAHAPTEAAPDAAQSLKPVAEQPALAVTAAQAPASVDTALTPEPEASAITQPVAAEAAPVPAPSPEPPTELPAPGLAAAPAPVAAESAPVPAPGPKPGVEPATPEVAAAPPPVPAAAPSETSAPEGLAPESLPVGASDLAPEPERASVLEGFATGKPALGRWKLDSANALQSDPDQFYAKLVIPLEQGRRSYRYSFSAKSLGKGWVGLGIHLFAPPTKTHKGYGDGRSILVWLTRDPVHYQADRTRVQLYRSRTDSFMVLVGERPVELSIFETNRFEIDADPVAGSVSVRLNGAEALRVEDVGGLEEGVAVVLRSLDKAEFGELRIEAAR